jgi:opacity protein-like surface antigen
VQAGVQQTPNSNYGNGGEYVVRYEHPIYGDLNVGLEGAYHGATSHNSDTGTYGDVSGWSLLPELIYYPSFGWKVKPYLLGGLGWSWWNFDRSQDLINKQIEVKLGNSFATKAGIGFDYPIGRNWSINVEWDYFHSHVPKEAHDSLGHNSIVITDEKTIGQEEFDLVIGVRYSF